MAGFSTDGSNGGNPTVKKAGVLVGTRQAINLIEGANITLTVADDAANGEVDVTVAASASGSAGVDLKEEGVTQGTATSVDFVGSMVTAAVAGAAGTVTLVHGDQAGGSLHADVVAGGASGFMTGAQATKLAGIATGATNGITTQEEGAGGGSNQTTLNFVGAGVTASVVGAVTTVTIPGGVALADGDYGDITVGGTGTTLTIDNNAVTTAKIADAQVTLAKMANLAQDQVIGRVTASTGVPETFTVTSALRSVLDDTTVAAAVNTLGGAASTGSGGLVRATSPTLVTPTLGAAGATSLTMSAAASFLYAEATNNTAVTANCYHASLAALAASGLSTGPAASVTNVSGGYPLRINQDTTSPVRAGISWPSGDALPTGAHVVGDIANVSGVLYVCTAAGTPGTWQRYLSGSTGSTDNRLLRSDGTGGFTTQASGINISDADAIDGHYATVNAQTGTTYTLQASDAGKHVLLTNAAAITVTVPSSLLIGFQCSWEQGGAGQVTFSAGSGATVNNRSTHTKSAGQHAVGGISVKSGTGANAVATLYGDTAA